MQNIESVQERDVDLLLLEELNVDFDFAHWFISTLNLPDLTSVIGAWRSVSDFGLGETDILFSYQSNNDKVYLLLENKLDASFQENQAVRYKQRAQKYKDDNECNHAFSILIAPKEYCHNQKDFDTFLTYERIIDFLKQNPTKRNQFKAELLTIAVEKLRRGYQPINDSQVQKFWLEYWEYIQSNHPSLEMKRPDIVPFNSDWPMLYDTNLNQVVFYHKLSHGFSDASFKSENLNLDDLFKVLPKEMMIERHKKSFSIRMQSPKIDRTQPFFNQIDQISLGLKNMEIIRNWIKENLSSVSLPKGK